MRRARTTRVGQLNLTSMIDVIFLLLIYFVITADFRVDEGVLTASLPTGGARPKPASLLPPQKVVIRLEPAPDGTGVVIRRGTSSPATFTDLRDSLDAQRLDPSNGRTAGTLRPDNPIVIQADATVRWQHVANAFNAALAAGYTNVALARPPA